MLTRRETIGGLGAAAALMSTSGVAQAQTRRKGPRLRPGDTVGVIAPAGVLPDPAGYDRALQRVRDLGLVPKEGANLRDRHGYLAGTDWDRAADIDAMYADGEVKAVLAIRGGWGCARLLPYLNWNVIRANPKLLVGFSDITALHLAIAARGGFPTIHGPNIGSDWGPQSMETFRRLAFEGAAPLLDTTPPALMPPAASSPPAAPVVTSPPPRPLRTRAIREGRATGRLLGGNLTVFAALAGTPYLPSFDGAIIFLEDVGEQEYRVDRMLTQLALAGVFRRAAGVVFGQCTDCATPNGSVSLDDVLNNHFFRLGIPAFTGAWFGHISNQLNIPVGVRAEMDAAAGTIRVLEPAVA